MSLNNDCPCKLCVPPKRCAGCHSVCVEYKEWSQSRQYALEQLKKKHREDDDCFPNKLRKRGKHL